MARIVFGSYMVRYPLGGMMSYVLQYLVGFQRLGHEVWFVEKATEHRACFDPVRGIMTDDPAAGTRAVNSLLTRFHLGDRWAFADVYGRYHGMSRGEVREAFATADVFVDMGTHGAWLEEAATAGLRVLIDGEPGFNQMKMAVSRGARSHLEGFDRYYTNGLNVGTPASSVPTVGKEWGHIVHPVVIDLFDPEPPARDGAWTTILNWRAHEPLTYEGRTYGQKDVEFTRFLDLPQRADVELEVAVAGDPPREELRQAGWSITDAHAVTESVESFRSYLTKSRGEFTVCKNVFVETNSGWFSDRSAAYLAFGRPVVMQDTGFSRHLPVGEGLHAVETIDEAASAIESIEEEYDRHSRAARRVAEEHLAARRVLSRFLQELGLRP